MSGNTFGNSEGCFIMGWNVTRITLPVSAGSRSLLVKNDDGIFPQSFIQCRESYYIMKEPPQLSLFSMEWPGGERLYYHHSFKNKNGKQNLCTGPLRSDTETERDKGEKKHPQKITLLPALTSYWKAFFPPRHLVLVRSCQVKMKNILVKMKLVRLPFACND